ncbi:hypothetical protein [Rhizobium sp. ZW T2_16]|uniref:hypothetical protein n=1 Tax=Rhizobium sp. ZW T2_16 TaxID=3378083 RepID=UPI0038532768
MDIEELILQLKDEKWPSRKLDTDIAAFFGFKRASSAQYPKFSWHHPNGTTNPLPKFTYSMQDAYELLLLAAPGCVGACSWEEGQATARVENGPFCMAATPAMAICIAALVELRRNHQAGSMATATS